MSMALLLPPPSPPLLLQPQPFASPLAPSPRSSTGGSRVPSAKESSAAVAAATALIGLPGLLPPSATALVRS